MAGRDEVADTTGGAAAHYQGRRIALEMECCATAMRAGCAGIEAATTHLEGPEQELLRSSVETVRATADALDRIAAGTVQEELVIIPVKGVPPWPADL